MNHDIHGWPGVLGIGEINTRISLLIQIVVFHVGHDADDFLGFLSAGAEIESLPDWLLTLKELSGKRLIDQNYAGRHRVIVVSEQSPPAQRSSDRVEVTRRRDAKFNVRLLAFGKRRAANYSKRTVVVAVSA